VSILISKINLRRIEKKIKYNYNYDKNKYDKKTKDNMNIWNLEKNKIEGKLEIT
jgi:hypothetical protein